MAWRPHPRKITKEQFSKGTTIDGSRLDKAAQDIIDRFNSLPKDDIKNRYMHSILHGGWSPMTVLNAGEPWYDLPFFDMDQIQIGTLAAAPLGTNDQIQNLPRMKGYRAPGVTPGDATQKQCAWGGSFRFASACILTNINFAYLWDHPLSTAINYSPNVVYGANPPDGFATGDPDEGLDFLVYVDNPFVTENRKLDDVEFEIHRFQAHSQLLSQIQPSVAHATWQAPVPTNFPGYEMFDGLIIDEDVEIPIYPGARVRWAFVLPAYAGGITATWGVHKAQPNVSITLLREILGE